MKSLKSLPSYMHLPPPARQIASPNLLPPATTSGIVLRSSHYPVKYAGGRPYWALRARQNVSPSGNRTTTGASLEADAPDVALQSAADVIRNFYDGINSQDLDSVEDLISENCVYEDLIFPSPFVGRRDILQFFQRFIDSISSDLQFVIDDLSTEDSSAVGVKWHLEWKGKPFPFSKGCSFYRLEVVDTKRQIIYARDSVEPAIKPGDTALILIRGVTWLLQQFPQLADKL